MKQQKTEVNMMNTRLNVKSRKRIAGLLAFLIAAFIVGGVIGA